MRTTPGAREIIRTTKGNGGGKAEETVVARARLARGTSGPIQTANRTGNTHEAKGEAKERVVASNGLLKSGKIGKHPEKSA